MQVFNLSMKIIRKNKVMMLVYIFIFLLITVLISSFSAKEPIGNIYTASKADVAFFSGENTPLVAGLKQELSKTANFVDIADDTEALQDALYFRKVTYIVRVPRGFTEKFMNGESVSLERTSVPGSVYGTYVDMKINRYLNTASLYVKSEKGITQERLVSSLKDDMSKTASVTMGTAQRTTDDSTQPFASYYFNYLAYVLPAVLIYSVSVVLEVCNGKDLRSRSFCSPMKPRSYNAQLILSVTVFSVACWLILLLPCAAFDPKHFFSAGTPYQILNSFAFLLTAVGISYLIGNLVNEKAAISALANVCALGPCFIAGVFIPQKLLSDSVLKVASFTPVYWYIKANETIGNVTHFSTEVLSPAYGYMLVELGFAAAFFALGAAASRHKRAGD